MDLDPSRSLFVVRSMIPFVGKTGRDWHLIPLSGCRIGTHYPTSPEFVSKQGVKWPSTFCSFARPGAVSQRLREKSPSMYFCLGKKTTVQG